MEINYGIIHKKRQEKGIDRVELARLLGVTDNYMYMIEKGIRIPSLKLLEQISDLIDVPLKNLMDGLTQDASEEYGEALYDCARDYIELLEKLHRERHSRKNLDERNGALERQIEHQTAVLHLHLQLGDILIQDIPKNEKMQKIEQLARVTSREGEVSFNEMLAAFRVKRPMLKSWLVSERQVYKCKYIENREVVATTPGEAGLRLCCFDCEHHESLKCHGYGDEKRPENVIELLTRLEANGVYNRTEQAELLEESYGLKISPHQISEMVYRDKNGLQMPEAAFNLEVKPR